MPRRLPVVQINDGQIRLFENQANLLNEGNINPSENLNQQLLQFLNSIDMTMEDFNMLPTEVRSDMISQFVYNPYEGRIQ